jgi:hypothetical protein
MVWINMPKFKKTLLKDIIGENDSHHYCVGQMPVGQMFLTKRHGTLMRAKNVK